MSQDQLLVAASLGNQSAGHAGSPRRLPSTRRGQRRGEHYLGPDRTAWGRFAAGVFDDPATVFVRLEPTWLRAVDLSW